MAKIKRPIGVFDSGLGGLTVVHELRRALPHEDIVYFGDLARLPYGTKSKKQIIEFSCANVQFLKKQKAKAVVVACNSSASCATGVLKRQFALPIIDVISAAVEDAVMATRTHSIGVLGTTATIESDVYQRYIKKVAPRARVEAVSCPLFVPLVEEGWLSDTVTKQVIERYVAPLKKKRIDTLILGCTHYPLLKEAIADVMGNRVTLIESAPGTVRRLQAVLEKKHIATKNATGSLKVFVSDKSRNFVEIGSRFLGSPLKNVKVVHI